MEKVAEKMREFLKEMINFLELNTATEHTQGQLFAYKMALDHLEFLIKLYND